MRSLLAQASSVEKAVRKAWLDAGMPTEFNIKVLDFGTKGFLGFTKRPVIISISYEPKKQTALNLEQQNKKTLKSSTPNRKNIRPKRERKAPVQSQKKEKVFWTEQMVKDITIWVKEITSKIKISTRFETKVNKKVLNVSFSDRVLGTKEEERLLFSALSYTLIQFTKKKYKKKFQGYQVLISSKKVNKYRK